MSHQVITRSPNILYLHDQVWCSGPLNEVDPENWFMVRVEDFLPTGTVRVRALETSEDPLVINELVVSFSQLHRSRPGIDG